MWKLYPILSKRYESFNHEDFQMIEVAIKNKQGCHPVDNYVDVNVSDKVVKLIQSYVGVVNKMVWRKE